MGKVAVATFEDRFSKTLTVPGTVHERALQLVSLQQQYSLACNKKGALPAFFQRTTAKAEFLQNYCF